MVDPRCKHEICLEIGGEYIDYELLSKTDEKDTDKEKPENKTRREDD